MPTDTKTLGDMKMPVGTYKTTKHGQDAISKRHREVGTVLQMTFDQGNTQLFVKLHLEILSLEMQALLRANKLIKEGDDAIMCPVYARERNTSAAAPAAEEPQDGHPSDGPF